jgi:uncharacterized protein (DUF4415 family)
MPKPLPPLTTPDGEVRELRAEDFTAMRGANELPASLQRKLGVRGPQRAPTKERITIRLSREVVSRFRATGEGWQARVDAALKDWLEAQRPAGRS